MAIYGKELEQASSRDRPVASTLPRLVLNHLSDRISRLVAAEIEEALGRARYERHRKSTKKQYCNGYHKARSLTSGMEKFPVQLPRLQELFNSKILTRYQRRNKEIAQTLPELYLHGLATGDLRRALGPRLEKMPGFRLQRSCA
jgi:putative transposase